MKLIVNGEEQEYTGDVSLEALITHHGLNSQVVVAEVNGTIVKSEQFADTVLSGGDTIELVRIMGGG